MNLSQVIKKAKNLASLIRLSIVETEQDYTSGSVKKAIFLLSVPMILEMAGEAMFALADAFFISRVSTEAVATIGLTESIMMIVYSVAIGLSMGGTAMIARRIGEGEKEKASFASFQVMALGLLASIVIGVIGWFIGDDILALMGGSEEMVKEGAIYTKIMLGGNIVIMYLFILNGIFRGAGDAAIAMKSLWIANLINVILDPLLIFGIGFFPEWGIMGAAIATNIGRGVAVLYQLYILFSVKGRIQVFWRHMRLIPNLIRSLLKISSGSTLQYLIGSAGWIFIVWIIGKFGPAAVAGYTIAFRVIIFSILPSWGMANAAATLVGQNLGAKEPERAEQSVWLIARYNFYFLMGLSVILFVLSRPILLLFGNDPQVLEYAVTCTRIIAFGYVFFGYGMIVSQSFNGAGDTWTPTWLNLISFWIIQMPLAWLIAVYFEFGVTSVYIVSVICETIFALLCIYLFRQGKWKNKLI